MDTLVEVTMVISNGVNGALGRGLGSLIPNASARKSGVEQPGVLLVPVHQIVTNPHQPRKSQDHAALEDLINSIREHGIVQPLVMVKSGSGYQLIAGERRLKAAQILGLKTVPAIVRDATTQQQLELAIVENVQRKDLNPMERAHAYHKLIEEFGLTQEQVAKRVGKSRVTVANTLRLLDLPAEVQAAVAEEKITEGHAKVIASAPTSKEQLRLFAAILKGSLSVRSGEQLAQRTVPNRRLKKPANPTFVAAEDDLRELFGTRVRIDKHGRVGNITIEFYSDEEFEALVKRLRQSKNQNL
ncbi:MAG: ParB/RepB/Spo0J family partition protein [Candidatus Kerfeldbacteria bacterium]|nr:ParB/RepB/Spo0J family partition protein [Candidatus Kerfeldbacteria bacterium]